MEFSVRRPSPLNTYSYVQEENSASTRILFRKSLKVIDIFEKQSWLYGCRSIQSKKEIHSNRKFGYHCCCKIKEPNKNFLKLKFDWWCSYFDTTDGYLRFILTDGQMTVLFFLVVIFSGHSWCSYFDTTDDYLRFIPTDGQTTVPFFLPVIIFFQS